MRWWAGTASGGRISTFQRPPPAWSLATLLFYKGRDITKGRLLLAKSDYMVTELITFGHTSQIRTSKS